MKRGLRICNPEKKNLNLKINEKQNIEKNLASISIKIKLLITWQSKGQSYLRDTRDFMFFTRDNRKNIN